jgi:predicted CXXCH cytochrome family protein
VTQTVVAYGQGMSEWCANCHTAIHNDSYTSGTDGLRHPAGNGAKLPSYIVTNYTTYLTSGKLTGSPATSYSTLAPFEIGTNTYATLKTWAKNDGSAAPIASTTSNVMCLSCHRAHASGFESMTRAYRLNEFITVADASNNAAYDASITEGKINYGKSVLEQQAAYQGRTASYFGPYARNYCNKCHAKD